MTLFIHISSLFIVLCVLLLQTTPLHAAFVPSSSSSSWGPLSTSMLTLTTTIHQTLLTERRHNCYCSIHYAATNDDDSPEPNIISNDSCDVAIFGGGFGGLYTALAMARLHAQQQNSPCRSRRPLDICLVEPTDSFVFLPLLYDLTVGTATEAEVCPRYQDLLQDTGIRFVKASLDTFLPFSNNDIIITNNSQRQAATKMTATLKPSSLSSNKKNSSLSTNTTTLSFSASVIAVGASPGSILAQTPGALKYAQPFYTARDAQQTRKFLTRLEQQQQQSSSSLSSQRRSPPRIAIVGGGFGGVELAASVQRKLNNIYGSSSGAAQVTLLSRGPPMASTRAEPLIQKALSRLGVSVQECSVEALLEYHPDNDDNDNADAADAAESRTPRVIVKRKPWKKSNDKNNRGDEESFLDDSEPWDAVLWTAGSGAAFPVGGGEGHGLDELQKSDSGRLATDSTLRCFAYNEQVEELTTRGVIPKQQPPVWALGDCAEIISSINNNKNNNKDQPAVPKTAQAAMQQADVVAYNVLAQLETPQGKQAPCKQFQYQDLGSMLMLGGPNAALMAPRDGSLLSPIFTPALDTATAALGFADKILQATVGKSPIIDKFGLSPETLGLSLGSYGLGVESGAAPGTLAGTLTGAARRAVYAARMPTNRQRAVAATSAAISTATALAQEVITRNQQSESN